MILGRGSDLFGAQRSHSRPPSYSPQILSSLGIFKLALVHFDSEESPDSGNKFKKLLLDVRCRYLVGSEAEYLREGSIRRVSGRVVYDINKSQTDLLSIQIGIAVRF